MRHHKKNARYQFWSAKAIAKRHRLLAESRLTETHPVPATPRLTAGLKPGEVALVGWQYAPAVAPKWLTQMVERNQAKAVKRERYERMMKRRAHQEGV
jgi:hypothetical protein